MNFPKSLKIGTRASPMALAQAEQVRLQLEIHYPTLKGNIDLIPFTTSGDRFISGPLRTVGGKGLFTKELEIALLENKIDCAVHSLKDMAAISPQGLILTCVLERTELRDAFVSYKASSLDTLEGGSIVGTASLRRAAQVKKVRPDLICLPVRGNMGTRLKKLRSPLEQEQKSTKSLSSNEMPEKVDALIVSHAGLCRLNLANLANEILDPHDFVPAPGQGAIIVQVREDRQNMIDLFTPINHVDTYHCIQAERAFLKIVEGSCQLPVGAYARKEFGKLMLTGFLGTDYDERTIQETMEGDFLFAEDIGKTLGFLLKKKLDL